VGFDKEVDLGGSGLAAGKKMRHDVSNSSTVVHICDSFGLFGLFENTYSIIGDYKVLFSTHLDGDVCGCQLDVLVEAFLNSRNITQGGQRTIPSLFNVPPNKQRIIGDQPIDTNINQVLDQVEPVGCPRLDLHAVSVSGIDHGLVGERDESGKRGVGDGRGVGCRYGREEIGADGCGRLDWSYCQRKLNLSDGRLTDSLGNGGAVE
jgi:hypothetical protein